MPYPTTCPACGADLTESGAVGQDATEIGTWIARVRPDGDYVDFESFVTGDTMESDEVFCTRCGRGDHGVPETYLREG